MKDQFLLLITGIVGAGLAWGFWVYTQELGFVILILISSLGSFVDNRRLRQRLKDAEATIQALRADAKAINKNQATLLRDALAAVAERKSQALP